MNWNSITAAAILGIICITAIAGFDLFVKWKTAEGNCTLAVKTQHELMVLACKTTIEETLANIDKEFCATWDADLELERLKNSGITPEKK